MSGIDPEEFFDRDLGEPLREALVFTTYAIGLAVIVVGAQWIDVGIALTFGFMFIAAVVTLLVAELVEEVGQR